MKSTIIHFILLQILLFSFSQTKILNYSDIWNTTQVSNIYGCADSSFGESVSSAGDFNGDGIEDIIVGAINYGSSVEDLPGAAYIFYGKKGGLGPNLNLTNGLDITEGFKIVGYDHSQFGVTVSSAGDFNGDGIDDVIIGAQQQNDQDGSVYIIFGKKGGYQSDIDVSKDLDPSVGIEIDGKSGELLGASVANLGDINGDGIDDVIFGTFNQDTFVARTYVLFGSKNISQELPIDLSTLSQTSRGFQISSNDKNKGMNDAVSSAGDMNDDGIPDILVASSNGGISTRKACGLAYVFYGRKDGKLPDIDLDQTLSPDQGFRIIGAATLSFLGNSIANLGDVNGDGIDDIVLGDSEAGHYLTKTLGQVYVIYGKKGNFDGDIDLHDFKPEQGFLITGPLKPGYLGVTVSATGDLNQDNINDFAVISSDLVNQLYTEGGNLYVIYGQKEQTRKNINLLLNLNPSDGYKITAPTEARFFGGSMASADVNDDGIPDIVVGAPATFNSTWGTDGATYVIYSQPK